MLDKNFLAVAVQCYGTSSIQSDKISKSRRLKCIFSASSLAWTDISGRSQPECVNLKRNPQIEAFCELVVMGWPLVHASEYAGLRQNSSNASKLARHPYPAQRIQALQNAGPEASRMYAFAAMILVTGSLSKAYRETYPCDALKAATVRARASRLFKHLPVQEKLSALTLRFPAGWIHEAALPLIERAESNVREAEDRRWREVRFRDEEIWIATQMARLEDKRKAKAAKCVAQSERRLGPKLTGHSRKLCGARTRSRDSAPCQCKVVPGRTRCRFHGGLSTGPRTPEGKARCAEGVRRHFARTSIIQGELW